MSDAKKRYVVTGHMATFDTATDQGPMRVAFYRGQQVPDDAKPEQIEHNLSVNLIAEVPSNEPVGLDSAGAAIAGTERFDGGMPGSEFRAANAPQSQTADEQKAADDKAKADAEVAEKRSAARAKLPADGSAPDGRAAQAVWAEYLVSKGSSYDDVKNVEKADLQKLAEQQKA